MPSKTDYFALPHGSFQCESYNWQEIRIAATAAGRKQSRFLTVGTLFCILQSAVASIAFFRKFDFSNRIVDEYPPFLASNLKQLRQNRQFAPDGVCRNVFQAFVTISSYVQATDGSDEALRQWMVK